MMEIRHITFGYLPDAFVVAMYSADKDVFIKEQRYIPERTCKPEHTREHWKCNLCDCVIQPGFMPEFNGTGCLHYCPNCGAKVI